MCSSDLWINNSTLAIGNGAGANGNQLVVSNSATLTSGLITVGAGGATGNVLAVTNPSRRI